MKPCALTRNDGLGRALDGRVERTPGSSLRVLERAQQAGIELRLWPSRLYALPVAMFTFLWLRFLWRWYSLIVLASADDARGFLMIFGVPFLLAGVSLIGTSLRLVIGKSVVTLDALRLQVGDEALGHGRRTALAATTSIARFVAESSLAEGEEERELDAWQVRAMLHDGSSVALPLPVRSLPEANDVCERLNRGLARARTPTGYRDSLALR